MNARAEISELEKCPSGILGLDEITFGGLPKGRPTLVCGEAGCGKTILGMEFLVQGALQYGEPGVYVSFEETQQELVNNFASFGYDLDGLIERKLLSMDYVYIERSEIEETGEYNLDGLFIRLGLAIDEIGAKRVVLDTLEALFTGFSDTAILRAELRRLFRWLKQKGVTAIITGERGDGTLTRYGLEEYVADCVILLDLRVREQIATRRIRIIKYRGSAHGSDEYPFLITNQGVSILPITTLSLDYPVSSQRISSGIPRLDTMLGGAGYYRGSSVLVSGPAGSGKSSLASTFVDAACRRGEHCLYVAFEESVNQILRNMCSIGVNLQPWVEQGLLTFYAARPSSFGLELHLVTIQEQINKFKPAVVVFDPISNLQNVGTTGETKSMLTRLIDYLKSQQITAMMTDLTHAGDTLERSGEEISSLIDTWLLMRDIELNGERNRGMYILKSRGMAHSNQIREFLMSDKGIDLVDVYLGPSGMLTGSARATQEAQEREASLSEEQEALRRQRESERKRLVLQAQMAALQAEMDNLEHDTQARLAEATQKSQTLANYQGMIGRLRKADR